MTERREEVAARLAFDVGGHISRAFGWIASSKFLEAHYEDIKMALAEAYDAGRQDAKDERAMADLEAARERHRAFVRGIVASLEDPENAEEHVVGAAAGLSPDDVRTWQKRKQADD